MEINWDFVETIAKAIVVLGGAGVSIYQVYSRLPKSRMTLTQDLQILKGLDKDDPAYPVIRAHVDSRVAQIYGTSTAPAEARIKPFNVTNLILGIVFLAVFVPWTYSLYNQDSLWWLLTGFPALGGLGNIGIAFDRDLRKQS